MYKVFYFNPLRECTYVVSNNARECVIIDPGAITERERERLAGYIGEEKLQVRAVLLTHGHFDHIFGLKDAVERWSVPVYMHPKDQSVFEGAAGFSHMVGLPYEPYEGPQIGQGVMFCGDTIFRGAVGRTDHPGGDFDQMMESIRRCILPLPPATRLIPGHGHETTVGEEKQTNPFLL